MTIASVSNMLIIRFFSGLSFYSLITITVMTSMMSIKYVVSYIVMDSFSTIISSSGICIISMQPQAK